VGQDIFSNKSVIKIKGQNDYEYKFPNNVNEVKNDDPFGKSSSLVLMGSGSDKTTSIRFS
jgi:hypothetical protein